MKSASGEPVYNNQRDHSPETGRYLQSDPLLGLNRFVTGRMDFIVPVMIFSPTNMHPYVYVENKPLWLSDPEGLGAIGVLQCLYYSRKMSKFQEKCKNECPPDPEGMAKFIDTYSDNGSYVGAIWSCACAKAGPELCADWATACTTAPLGPGPKLR
jgi:RHS repeat-associated protein